MRKNRGRKRVAEGDVEAVGGRLLKRKGKGKEEEGE
jgi:hypothetical protein